MSIYPSQPVFIFTHGFQNNGVDIVDPPIFPIEQPTNGEQTCRLNELIQIISYIVNLKKPICLVHSPYLRCRETAATIANLLIKQGVRHLSVQIDHDWMETGNLVYKHTKYLPFPIEAISDESNELANHRYVQAFERYVTISKDNDCIVIVVTHKDAITSIIRANHKTAVQNVPPLSWFAKYADTGKISWCPDIKCVSGQQPIPFEIFIGEDKLVTKKILASRDTIDVSPHDFPDETTYDFSAYDFPDEPQYNFPDEPQYDFGNEEEDIKKAIAASLSPYNK